MSLPIPLSVTLSTGRTRRRITSEVRDLSFRSTAPGGFASATISLNRPLQIQPDDIAYYARLLVHDTRNGRVVWEGRLEDPGRSAGADGTVWDLAAIGPAGHVHDRNRPLIYIDTSLERWKRHSSSTRLVQTDTDERSDDVPSLLLKFPEGATAAQNATATVVYLAVKEINSTLARVSTKVINGGTSSQWDNVLLTATDTDPATEITSPEWSGSEATLTGSRGGSPAIPSGHSRAFLRIVRTAASGVATANSWGEFYEVYVRGLLKDASGNDITTGYGNDYVLAYEVVRDLLGRLLDQYDGPGASVATTSGFQINQLAYVDGATPAEVLDDLMLIEPAFYWAAWEADAAGLYRFEWVEWPTSVRYHANVTDGYNSTGSADGLFNAVNVRWRSPGGNIRIRRGTQAVPELDDAGITREETLDLGDNIASATIGDQVRDQFLADHMTPRNAGSLTIARPILDSESGLMVSPWEIRPGALIRVRGILPRQDSLNATARDGVTVFKIASVTFNAGDATATLELDSYAPSTARAIADLQRRRRRRR